MKSMKRKGASVVSLDVSNVFRYYSTVIRSFRDKRAQAIFEREFVKRFSADVQRLALRKLMQLHAAGRIETLRVPPGNRLESLRGDRAGQHSIRVNDQWRICFVWKDGHAHEVEIVDYH